MILDLIYFIGLLAGICNAQSVGFVSTFLRIARTIFTVALSLRLAIISGLEPQGKVLVFLLVFGCTSWFISVVSRETTKDFHLKRGGDVSQLLAVIVWAAFFTVFCSFIVGSIEAPEIFNGSIVYGFISKVWEVVGCKFAPITEFIQ